MDRNQLEQEAIRQLNLGSHEGALKAYTTILKLDPRDRRIRQKVGELYLKLGRPLDAEKQLREVAEGLVREGAHRAAVSVLKQLVGLKPDDAALQIDLAECYVASGYSNDARGHFDTAMRLWIGVGKAGDAARAARRLAELSPGEPALRLKVAELLEAAGDAAGAAAELQDVADEYRRRGRPDEVGRIAEMALKLRPDDPGLLLDAAAARVEAGEHKRALAHLQLAFAQAPRDPRTLDLLARAFEGVGQADKALKVLGELARVAADRKDPVLEVDALRRAAALTPGDADLQGRLAAAEQRVSRLERRVTQLVLAQPVNEAELRAQVRAEVYLRYGFADRAKQALGDALAAAPDSLPLLASMVEAEAMAGRTEDAIRYAERLLPRAGTEAAAVLDRLAVLKGHGPTDAGEPHAPAASSPVAAAHSPAAPLSNGEGEAERKGDGLAEAGDAQGALLAWREALAADPANERILRKIAALRERARAAEAPRAADAPGAPEPVRAPEPFRAPDPDASEDDPFADFGPVEDGTFSEVDPAALDEVADAGLDEARSLVAVGMWADALALLDGVETLEAAVLRAQALRGSGDVARALDAMRQATNDADEADPAYRDALFELSALYTATGKARAALRLLEELRDLDEGYRAGEVEARMRGLQRLLK